MKQIFFFVLFILLVSPIALAHEEGEEEEISIDDKLRQASVFYLYLASTIIALFVIVAVYAEKRAHFTDRKKMILFLGIIVPAALVTVYLVGATIYLNSISQTEGPVHWHADYEIYACGNKIEMKEPTGMSNKVGSEAFHHHGDNRIHVEGVLVDEADADLHNFFEVTEGELTHTSISIPTKEYVATFKNGDSCNGYQGVLQVFVYKIIDGKAVQEKLTNFEDYVLSPYANVPPGDCIVVEFDTEKEKTNRMCETYRIAIKKGALSYGG